MAILYCFIVLSTVTNLLGHTTTIPPTTGSSATSKPATGPTTTAEATVAKRSVPITIGGQADARAPGYIVLFENNVDAPAELARLEKAYDFKRTHIYNMPGFKGFAGNVSAESIEKMRWELSIKSIEHDGVASINGGGMGAN
jgi:hypothetical protein